MGDSLDKVVALAGTVRVESHKRVSKSGNVTTVDAYTRSLRGMSLPELRAEAGKSSNNRMKQSQITNELRRRLDGGSQERSSQIMNPSTAPTADGRAAMEKKTDAELKTFAADTGIRAADRKFAEDELKRRGVKTSEQDAEANLRNIIQGMTKRSKEDGSLDASRRDLYEAMDRDRAILEKSGINPDTNEAFQAKYKYAMEKQAASGDGKHAVSETPSKLSDSALKAELEKFQKSDNETDAERDRYRAVYQESEKRRRAAIPAGQKPASYGLKPMPGMVDDDSHGDSFPGDLTNGPEPTPKPVRNRADESVEKIMKAQKKPKGVTLADIAYDLGVSMAAVKGMVERSKYIEKRGTRFWYVDPNN